MRSITSGISFAPKSSDHIRTHAASISSTFQPLYVSSIFPPLLMPLRSVILADLNFGRCAICAARPAAVGTRVRLYLNSPKTAFALHTVSWFLLCLFSSHSHTPRRRRSFSSLGAFHQTSASFQRLRTADGEVDGSSHLHLLKRSYETVVRLLFVLSGLIHLSMLSLVNSRGSNFAMPIASNLGQNRHSVVIFRFQFPKFEKLCQ